MGKSIIKTPWRLLASALALPWLLFASSCERAELQEMPEYVTSIEVNFEQPDFSEFETKASYSLDANNRPVASWSEKDIIGIYPVGGDQVAFPLSGSITDGKAVFDGGSWSLKSDRRYAAYCPFDEDYYHCKESSLPVTYLGQKQTGDNNVDHLGAFAYMASVASSPNSEGAVSIALKSVGCIVQLKLKLPEGMPVKKLTLTDHTSDLVVGGEMDLTQENVTALKNLTYSKSISIDCKNLTAGTEAIKVWMMLPPQDLRGHELELTAISESVAKTVSRTMASCTRNLTANGALVLDFDDASSDYSSDYLSFAAEEPGSTISMQIFMAGRWTQELPSLEYSFDKEIWTPFEIGTTTVTLPKIGDRVYFRAARYNTTFNQDSEHRVTFVMTGKIAAGGNIMTLLDQNGLHEWVPSFAFSHLFSSCESLVSAPELPSKKLARNCYEAMFIGCSALAVAPELPATKLNMSCYMSMFWGCTSLESSPYLPATELEPRCYDHMFHDCSNLKRIDVGFTDWKEKDGCTSDWVTNVAPTGSFVCPTSLVTMIGNDYVPEGWSLHNGAFIPDLLCFTAEAANSTVGMKVAYSKHWKRPPLRYSTDGMSWEPFDIHETTVTLKNAGDKVYFMASEDNETFSRDDENYLTFEMTGKIAASGSIMTLLTPSGAGKSVPEYAFINLFSGCTALTSAPKLPATELADYCYYQMFKGCSGLTSAPVLPATEMAESCYRRMFQGCSGLTSAPVLPATEMAESCYRRMFLGCSGLASAPELPSMKLADYCYESMFWNCSSLTSAPELPAMELISGCYEAMFAYCSKLNRIEASFTDWNESGNSTYGWVDGVASTGTFVCQKGLEILYDDNHIPEGWTVNEVVPDYLCFTAEEVNSTVWMTAPTGVGGWDIPVLQYSTDLESWQPFVMGTTTVSLANVGDKVYFRTTKENSGFYTDFGSTKFEMSGKIAASGNIMTLLDPLGRSDTVPAQAFRALFSGCTALTSAPELPATTLAEECYYQMFKDCSGLTSAPELPAMKLAKYCYESMFASCSGLTTAPELPATKLAEYCYESMFASCSGLTTAPELPATKLAYRCYYWMFEDCRNLTSAPDLPATELAEYCYGYMFRGCSGLTTAPELPATKLAEYCYESMFDGCRSLTSAPDLPATELAEYCYAYMFHGCSGLTTAPELPAMKLAFGCYYSMFYGCSKLNRIEVAFTYWDHTGYCTRGWVSGVASTGTFVCPKNLPIEYGEDYIPSGWTVVTK